MRISSIIKYGSDILKDPFLLSASRPIFIISHMRSYSSLLLNILSSNDEIYGGIEMLQSYRNYKDLMKLQVKAKRIKGRRAKFVIDKILNDPYVIHYEFLRSYRPVMIFTFRDPLESVNSIIDMHQKYTSYPFSKDEVCKYYLERQKTIIQMIKWSHDLGLDAISFRAERIVDDNERILRSLTGFLKLKHSLSPNYEVHDFIGKPMLGDPSPNIRAGKLVESKGRRNDLSLDKRTSATLTKSSKDLQEIMMSHSKYLG